MVRESSSRYSLSAFDNIRSAPNSHQPVASTSKLPKPTHGQRDLQPRAVLGDMGDGNTSTSSTATTTKRPVSRNMGASTTTTPKRKSRVSSIGSAGRRQQLRQSTVRFESPRMNLDEDVTQLLSMAPPSMDGMTSPMQSEDEDWAPSSRGRATMGAGRMMTPVNSQDLTIRTTPSRPKAFAVHSPRTVSRLPTPPTSQLDSDITTSRVRPRPAPTPPRQTQFMSQDDLPEPSPNPRSRKHARTSEVSASTSRDPLSSRPQAEDSTSTQQVERDATPKPTSNRSRKSLLPSSLSTPSSNPAPKRAPPNTAPAAARRSRMSIARKASPPKTSVKAKPRQSRSASARDSVDRERSSSMTPAAVHAMTKKKLGTLRQAVKATPGEDPLLLTYRSPIPTPKTTRKRFPSRPDAAGPSRLRDEVLSSPEKPHDFEETITRSPEPQSGSPSTAPRISPIRPTAQLGDSVFHAGSGLDESMLYDSFDPPPAWGSDDDTDIEDDTGGMMGQELYYGGMDDTFAHLAGGSGSGVQDQDDGPEYEATALDGSVQISESALPLASSLNGLSRASTLNGEIMATAEPKGLSVEVSSTPKHSPPRREVYGETSTEYAIDPDSGQMGAIGSHVLSPIEEDTVDHAPVDLYEGDADSDDQITQAQHIAQVYHDHSADITEEGISGAWESSDDSVNLEASTNFGSNPSPNANGEGATVFPEEEEEKPPVEDHSQDSERPYEEITDNVVSHQDEEDLDAIQEISMSRHNSEDEDEVEEIPRDIGEASLEDVSEEMVSYSAIPIEDIIDTTSTHMMMEKATIVKIPGSPIRATVDFKQLVSTSPLFSPPASVVNSYAFHVHANPTVNLESNLPPRSPLRSAQAQTPTKLVSAPPVDTTDPSPPPLTASFFSRRNRSTPFRLVVPDNEVKWPRRSVSATLEAVPGEELAQSLPASPKEELSAQDDGALQHGQSISDDEQDSQDMTDSEDDDASVDRTNELIAAIYAIPDHPSNMIAQADEIEVQHDEDHTSKDSDAEDGPDAEVDMSNGSMGDDDEPESVSDEENYCAQAQVALLNTDPTNEADVSTIDIDAEGEEVPIEQSQEEEDSSQELGPEELVGQSDVVTPTPEEQSNLEQSGPSNIASSSSSDTSNQQLVTRSDDVQVDTPHLPIEQANTQETTADTSAPAPRRSRRITLSVVYKGIVKVEPEAEQEMSQQGSDNDEDASLTEEELEEESDESQGDTCPEISIEEVPETSVQEQEEPLSSHQETTISNPVATPTLKIRDFATPTASMSTKEDPKSIPPLGPTQPALPAPQPILPVEVARKSATMMPASESEASSSSSSGSVTSPSKSQQQNTISVNDQPDHQSGTHRPKLSSRRSLGEELASASADDDDQAGDESFRSVVEVSSLDPRAAARAAAILKMNHAYIEHGILPSTTPQSHSIALPSTSDPAAKAPTTPGRRERQKSGFESKHFATLDSAKKLNRDELLYEAELEIVASRRSRSRSRARSVGGYSELGWESDETEVNLPGGWKVTPGKRKRGHSRHRSHGPVSAPQATATRTEDLGVESVDRPWGVSEWKRLEKVYRAELAKWVKNRQTKPLPSSSSWMGWAKRVVGSEKEPQAQEWDLQKVADRFQELEGCKGWKGEWDQSMIMLRLKALEKRVNTHKKPLAEQAEDEHRSKRRATMANTSQLASPIAVPETPIRDQSDTSSISIVPPSTIRRMFTSIWSTKPIQRKSQPAIEEDIPEPPKVDKGKGKAIDYDFFQPVDVIEKPVENKLLSRLRNEVQPKQPRPSPPVAATPVSPVATAVTPMRQAEGSRYGTVPGAFTQSPIAHPSSPAWKSTTASLPSQPTVSSSTTATGNAGSSPVITSSSTSSNPISTPGGRLYPQLNPPYKQRSSAIKALFEDTKAASSPSTSSLITLPSCKSSSSVKDLVKSFEEEGTLSRSISRSSIDSLRRTQSRGN